jgi:hypothetical protein
MPYSFLRIEDFHLERSPDGHILLCPDIQGVSIVTYYASNNHNCDIFIQQFKAMHRSIMNCTFAELDVRQHYKIVSLSKKSNTPIKGVPYILLYINGRPYREYTGVREPKLIINFIMNTLSEMQATQSFVPKRKPPRHPRQYNPQSGGQQRGGKKNKDRLPWGALPYNVAGSLYKDYKHAYKKDM